MTTAGLAGFGQMDPSDNATEYTRIRFLVRQALANVRTAIAVEVISCTNDGGVSPVGRVSVHPLVNQVDGAGNSVSHSTVFNLPYVRVAGGTNAIIMDPQAGDLGVMVCCDRDISSVKATGGEANPGSSRRFSMADAIYLGYSLGDTTPVQYILFNESGLTILSPQTVTVFAKDIVVHASHSYSQDVNGLGTSTVYEGGNDFTQTTYSIGANVTPVPAPWSPPQIPEPEG
jgi:hypothetical protein